MPASRTNTRHERSSFQGMAIIEGERSLDPAPDMSNFQLNQKRNERRRRSSSLAQSDQIRDIIAKTVKELAKKDSGGAMPQCTAEDRLKEVLAEVKESGNSSEKIFSFFRPEAGSSEELIAKNCVSTQAFKDGLSRLGYQWEDADELEGLIRRFDLNGDGMISLSEFEHYCLHEISSVAWKAERQRLEKAAESGDTSSEGSNSPRFDVKDLQFVPGPEVHTTSKLFWKLSVSVDVSLRYCSDLAILSMQVQHSETKEVLETFYINKSDCGIDLEALEEKATLAVQSSDEKTDEGKDVIRKNVEWEAYSSYLVARLVMTQDKETYQLSLAKLHGDDYERLDIEKPHNLQAPQGRVERKSADTKALQDEFETKVKSLRRDSRSARSSRKSAQELANVIESALSEVLMELHAEK